MCVRACGGCSLRRVEESTLRDRSSAKMHPTDLPNGRRGPLRECRYAIELCVYVPVTTRPPPSRSSSPRRAAPEPGTTWEDVKNMLRDALLDAVHSGGGGNRAGVQRARLVRQVPVRATKHLGQTCACVGSVVWVCMCACVHCVTCEPKSASCSKPSGPTRMLPGFMSYRASCMNIVKISCPAVLASRGCV